MGSTYFKREAEYVPGTYFLGGGEEVPEGDDVYGALRAIDATTGERRWEFRQHSPPWAGVLSTAGGLVFSGTMEGSFFALDALSGEPLWDFQTGGSVMSGPISYFVDGKQFVSVAAGGDLFVFALP